MLYKKYNTDGNYSYTFGAFPTFELLTNLSDKVKEIFFTGMVTSEQNGLYIQYADPDTHRIRKYYPDFLVENYYLHTPQK